MDNIINNYITLLETSKNYELEFKIRIYDNVKLVNEFNIFDIKDYQINVDFIKNTFDKNTKIVSRNVYNYKNNVKVNDKAEKSLYTKKRMDDKVSETKNYKLTLTLSEETLDDKIRFSPSSEADFIKITKRYTISKDEWIFYFDIYKMYETKMRSYHSKTSNYMNVDFNIIKQKITEMEKLSINTVNSYDCLIELEHNKDIKLSNFEPYQFIFDKFNFNNIYLTIKKLLKHTENTINFVKDITPKVINLDINIYKKHVYDNIKDFVILNKTNGIKCLIFIYNQTINIITDHDEYKIKTIPFKDINDIILLEGELIVDKEIYNIYMYNILYFSEYDVSKMTYLTKLKLLSSYEFDIEKIKLKIKVYYDLSKDDYKESVYKIINQKDEPSDGIIFTSQKGVNYKWKDVKDNTIDFYMKNTNNNVYQLYGYSNKKSEIDDFLKKTSNLKIRNTTLPFTNGMTLLLFYEVPLFIIDKKENTEHENFDGKIGEFIYDIHQKKWNLVKIRKDKSYPNSFYVAQTTYITYSNQLTLEKLFENNGYFKSKKDPEYKNAIYFNSLIKEHLYSYISKSYSTAYNHIELCCGHGQDLKRLVSMNAESIYMVDKDEIAIHDLKQRKMSIISDKITNIKEDIVDLSLKYQEIVNLMRVKSARSISCHFAIHYFMENEITRKNFIKLIDNLLEKDGRFIFTCFNGIDIFKKLTKVKTNESFNLKENDKIKYSIKKLYDEDKLESYGQKISVKLPFSGSEYYDEYLVNIIDLIEEFEKLNFTIEKFESFSNHFNDDKFKDVKMSEIDKIYNSNYCYVVLYKSDKPDKNKISINDIVNQQNLDKYKHIINDYDKKFEMYQLSVFENKIEFPTKYDDIVDELTNLTDKPINYMFNLHKYERVL
jgi:hypothetical protein